jgi:hypothetical protein
MMTIETSPAVDIWPKVGEVSAHRPPDRRVSVEIPGLSELPLLAALSQAVHLEMRAAGGWAARVDDPREKGIPGPKEFTSHRAENAARLLAIYTAVYRCGIYTGSFDPTPEAVKTSATRSYFTGRHYAQAPQPAPSRSVPPSSLPIKN